MNKAASDQTFEVTEIGSLANMIEIVNMSLCKCTLKMIVMYNHLLKLNTSKFQKVTNDLNDVFYSSVTVLKIS